MARSKYTFEKRQKEIARQKKQAEKAARRADAKKTRLLDGQADTGEDASALPPLDEPGEPGE